MGNKDLKREMERLWSYHYWETREVIRDAASNSPCLNVDVGALMENQVDLGNNFAKLSKSGTAGRKLTAALKEHINIAIQIVTAAIKGQDTSALMKTWSQNGSDIANIYYTYNKKTKGAKKMRYNEINNMMQMHLTTTYDEAVAIIQGNCQASYEKGEIALDHIYMMSDYIASKF